MPHHTSAHLSQRWLIIINPNAGNGSVLKQWSKLELKLLELLPQAEIVISKQVEDVSLIIDTALQQGVRYIMAVGGDGSAHQAVNAIIKQGLVSSTDITFAILPLGTGNDWIKTHGIPRKWDAWMCMFIKGNEHYQNIGLIKYYKNKQARQAYFMNVAGLAYDAFVVKEAEGKSSFLKGSLYYLWLSLSCLFKYTTEEATLIYDEKQVSQRFYTINIGIGQYSGGGMQLVPHAEVDGDHFALTYVGHLSRLSVILNSYRFYKGRVASFKKASLVKAKEINVQTNKNTSILIEADGEYLGEGPVSIELLPNALKFIGMAD